MSNMPVTIGKKGDNPTLQLTREIILHGGVNKGDNPTWMCLQGR